MANYPQTTTTAFTDDITITDGGKVGIGTTSPAKDLHVEANEPYLRIKGTRDDDTCASSTWDICTESDSPGNNVPMKLFIKEDGSAKVTLESDGNVGIGTTDPDEKLDVNGNAKIGTGGNFNSGHLVLGNYHIWVDDDGRLRIKDGTPLSNTDGTVVGSQSAA